MRGVVVEPGAPITSSVLRCVVDSDAPPDQVELLVKIAWYVDDQRVSRVAGTELPGHFFRRGQRVACEATGAEAPVRSEAVVVGNTAPLFDDVELALVPPPPPPPADPDDAPEPWTPEAVELRAYGFFDVDGDAEDWRVQWAVNGTPVEADRRLGLDRLFDELAPDADTVEVAVGVAPFDGVEEGRPIRRVLTVERLRP